MNLVMPPGAARSPAAVTARTIRFSSSLRARIAADAERCGRSFEGQVLAILRRHYGEDVDIAPAVDTILALAAGRLRGVADSGCGSHTGPPTAGEVRRPARLPPSPPTSRARSP